MEKLFQVAAGADPNAIRIRVKGAETLTVLPDGQLAIRTRIGDLKLTKPVAFQQIDGEKKDGGRNLPGCRRHVLVQSSALMIQLPPLVIDPLFATYLGGSEREYGYALKVNNHHGG